MLDIAVNNAIPGGAYAICVPTMGERIKVLREARGLTQSQVGRAVGVSKGAVSHWENGVTANIKLVTFLKLLDVLRTDYEYLVFGAGRSADVPSPAVVGHQKRRGQPGS
jgi:transcriptional regulator with XRE-family HTH domain